MSSVRASFVLQSAPAGRWRRAKNKFTHVCSDVRGLQSETESSSLQKDLMNEKSNPSAGKDLRI